MFNYTCYHIENFRNGCATVYHYILIGLTRSCLLFLSRESHYPCITFSRASMWVSYQSAVFSQAYRGG